MAKAAHSKTSKGNKQRKRNNPAPMPAVAESEAGAPGNLEKIREILFGAQVREHDKRFASVEDQLRREAGALRDEVARRLDALETYAKKEVGALLERLKKEQADRMQALKTLSEEMQKGVARLEDTLNNAERALREQLLDQSKSLGQEIRNRHAEGATALQAASEELRYAKADRSALSALFAEMAMRLSEDDEAGAAAS